MSSYNALLEAYPNRRPFVLSRSGTTGSQRMPPVGAVTRRPIGRTRQPVFGLGANVMISGQSHFGHDLGGFSGSVTGEQITRWYEWGALLPLCRAIRKTGTTFGRMAIRGASRGGSRRGRISLRRNGTDYCSLMRKNIQFRYQLMPYLYTLMYNDTINGTPINTPVAFNYYGDNNTLSRNEYDFLCGDFLLAAPIYTQGATTRTVYLPWPDDWYYYPTGAKYGGGQTVTVNTALGTLPLFVRGGAIIPMGPSMQYANQFQPSYLDINCWPDGNSVTILPSRSTKMLGMVGTTPTACTR